MTRIIAGGARGIRLAVPARGTRPTSDRVRESLFAGIEAAATPDTLGMLWSKLVINAAICPVSVLSGLPNGEMMKDDKWRSLLCKAAEESAKVAAAKGIKLSFADPVKAVLEVCEKTSMNISSMLQDIRRGRQTEIKEINGVVLHAAAEMGMDAPTNAMLCEKVVELENRGEHLNP